MKITKKSMNTTKKPALFVGLTSLIALLLVCSAGAQAVHFGHASKHAATARAAAASSDAVPAEQSALFSALRQPATGEVPGAVASQVTHGPADLAALALELGQARQVHAGGSTFYIVPGKGGLCLFLTDGSSVCSTRVDQVAKHGLSVSIVSAAPGPVSQMKSPIGPGAVTTYGIVPDAVTRLTATSTSGTTSEAVQSGNAYVLKTDGPILQKVYANADGSAQVDAYRAPAK